MHINKENNEEPFLLIFSRKNEKTVTVTFVNSEATTPCQTQVPVGEKSAVHFYNKV
jgi:hypothetical protein